MHQLDIYVREIRKHASGGGGRDGIGVMIRVLSWWGEVSG